MVTGGALPVSILGLFTSLTNVPVPLINVTYDVKVRSFAAQVTIHQVYRNAEPQDLECVYGFPVNDQASILGFTVDIGNRTLVSRFRRKEEAFREYSEALARQDGAYLLDQSDSSDDTFVLSVGRLPPGQECRVSIHYATTLESVTETRMRLTVPTNLHPRYNPTPQVPVVGVVAPDNYKSSVPYFATLNATIETLEEIKSVTSATHNLTITTVDPKRATVQFNNSRQPLDRDLVIEIELTGNPENYVEIEASTVSGGDYTAMYAFVPHFKPQATVNSELIFVVDCSGSMTGDRIVNARRAMAIFLRSIPEGAYFNFYLFGSRFESLFPQSEPYTSATFERAKVYADAVDNNMGGTEILEPLKKIYQSSPRAGFSRQIFVLTDGEVSNTQEVIALVRENAATGRLFSFGLGNNPSRSLVNGIATAGRGRAEFIRDGEQLEVVVGRQLSRALQPAVTDYRVQFHGVTRLQTVPTVLPPIFKGDRQLVYAIFAVDKASREPAFIELQIGGDGAPPTKIPINIPTKAGPKNQESFLSKLAARELIRELQLSEDAPPRPPTAGSLQAGRVAPPAPGNSTQEAITALSLHYGVLSKYVSLVAVESRNVSASQTQPLNTTDGNSTITPRNSTQMQLREVPIQLSHKPRSGSSVIGNARSPGGRIGYGGGRISYSGRGSSSSGRRLMFSSVGIKGASYGGGSRWSSNSVSGGSYGSAGPAFTVQLNAEPTLYSAPSMDNSAPSSLGGSGDASGTQVAGNVPTELTVIRLLNLQQWDGSWSLTEDLAKFGNTTVANLKSLAPRLADLELGTLWAVTVIRERFAEGADMWQAIVSKAEAFLAKQSNQVALQEARSVLVNLIKA